MLKIEMLPIGAAAFHELVIVICATGRLAGAGLFGDSPAAA